MDRDEAQAIGESLAALAPAVLHRLLLQSSEAALVTDADNRIVAVNAAFCHLSGYRLDEVVGRDPSLLSSGRQSKDYYAAMWQAIRADGVWSGEIWNRHRSGSIHPLWAVVSEVRDASGKLLNHVATYADIGERVEATQKLLHLAYHDPLTGLPNRLAFESQLELAIRSAERDGRQVALMLIDLDHFKTVNDTLGHPVGDELLKSVALRLRDCVRASDIVARLGGDEFVVVQPDIDSAMAAVSLAGKVRHRLAEEAHVIGPHQLFATPSIGISLYPTDGRDRETLLRNADVAMYHAKDAGRNNYQFYACAWKTRCAGRWLR